MANLTMALNFYSLELRPHFGLLAGDPFVKGVVRMPISLHEWIWTMKAANDD